VPGAVVGKQLPKQLAAFSQMTSQICPQTEQLHGPRIDETAFAYIRRRHLGNDVVLVPEERARSDKTRNTRRIGARIDRCRHKHETGGAQSR
jgi:hypothetical protein